MTIENDQNGKTLTGPELEEEAGQKLELGLGLPRHAGTKWWFLMPSIYSWAPLQSGMSARDLPTCDFRLCEGERTIAGFGF
ncbi:hypothetical protein TorRG33x02_292130 [Trema orientale]|uniref:Uncharacterized protein n=1 Tax=Trema orientale TaxID=63057 RepID=A0A2P5CAK6_TREOI|nr:hypothetical protein TorRG33x02_292130 [Trema orientale]